jgi:hypothetical protein
MGTLVWKKANPKEVQTVAERRKVPKETTVETIGALEDRYGARHLAVVCRRQLKKQTQGDGGSQGRLAAAHRRIRRAIPTPRRDAVVQGQTGTMLQQEPQKDDVLEHTSGATEMQQRHKELRPKKATTSRKQNTYKTIEL